VTGVSSYRVYRLSRAGRIVSGDWIEAVDDAGACEAAHRLCDDITPTVEVWRGAQRVAVLPCDPPSAQA